MTRNATLCAALLLASPAAAQDQAPPAAATGTETAPAVLDAQTSPTDFSRARKKVVECDGEKFVFAWGAGARPTKVTLCSKKGATPDEIVEMLEDAATKLEQTEIAEDRRAAIIQQIRAKISEVKGSAAAVPPPSAVVEGPVAGVQPPAVVQAPVAIPEPVVQPAIAAPVPKPVRSVAARPVAPAKPSLTIGCSEFGADSPCDILSPDTRLTVTAGEALPPGTGLRFVRRGETRAEVALERMRSGQSVSLALPRAVCSGVVKSEASIEVTRGGQAVDSLGPYLLRC